MQPSADRPMINGMDGILHRIEDDLAESWIAEWAGSGVDAIEVYLAKHLAFLTYLDRDEASAG